MILLQILDEGSITDSQGRKVDFKVSGHCLQKAAFSDWLAEHDHLFNKQPWYVLPDSDVPSTYYGAGSDILAHPTACDEDGVVTQEAREQVLERTSEYFPPELLNRLDTMLVFNKLSRASILEVVSLRLNDVSTRLKDRRIKLDVDDDARDWLARQGYSNVYGARAIARVVRTDVLFPLAQKLLKGTIRQVIAPAFKDRQHADCASSDGDTVSIRVQEDGKALHIKENHDPDSTELTSETTGTA